MTQVPAKKPNTIGELIKAQIPAIAMAVGGKTPDERKRRAERFARICLTAVRNTPKLANCTMESFAAAMMICAQLDLEPNTPQGLAFLIPYENRRRGITECQFQIGYKGLLQLAYRSGAVQSFNADVVYEEEIKAGMFEYKKGIMPSIRHDVDLLNPKLREGRIVAAYAACTLTGGQPLLRVVDAKEVERAQKTSASMAAAKRYNKADYSPWQTSPEAMWMKTAIKRLAAWMPQTEMLALAVDTDDRTERGESFGQEEKSDIEQLNSALANAVVEEPPALEAAPQAGETIDMQPAAEPAPAEVVNPETGEVTPAHAARETGTAPQPEAAAQRSSFLITCPKNGNQVDELECQGKPCRSGCPEFE